MKNIIGHDDKINELKNIVSLQNIQHAYMFSGIDGIGKQKIAVEFCKSILCDSPENGVYCDKCDSCKTFFNNSDFIKIEPEDGLIKVDVIRKLIDEVMLKPTISKRKAIIINDAHLMNENAQNALLKILEEPPSYATIILVTSNKEKIISTIKSRCNIINFNKLSDDEIKKIIVDSVDAEVLEVAGGSAGKYIKLKESKYLTVLEEFEKILNEKDLLVINKTLQNIKSDKNLKEYINEVLDLLLIKIHKNIKDDLNKPSQKIEIVEKIRNNILRNANLDIELDYLGLCLWEINKS